MRGNLDERGLAEVSPDMPAICDLRSMRKRPADRLGVGS